MSDLYAKALAAVHAYANRTVGSDPHADPEGIIDHPGDLDAGACTVVLVKDIAAVLQRHYPGFRWAIQPDERGGMVNLFCLDFSGTWGYRIKMVDVIHDPNRRVVIKAGREILRRFGYRTDVFRPHLMAEIKRNRNGEAIPDVSDLKQDRFTEAARIEKALAEGRARVIGQDEHGFDIVEVQGG